MKPHSTQLWLTAFQDEGIFGDNYNKATLTDDNKFSRTRDYTATIDLLRLLCDSLTRTIESWERFVAGEVQYFEVKDQQSLQTIWENYLASAEKDMSELRFLRRVLSQDIEALNNKRSGVSSFPVKTSYVIDNVSLSMPLLWSRVGSLPYRGTILADSQGSQ